MKEDFVTYNLAVKLKEKGFDWTCMAHFNTINYNEPTLNYNVTVYDIRGSNFKSLNKLNSFIDAPTISQVLKWLRNEKKIFINVDVRTNLEWYYEAWNINEKLSVLGNVPFNKSESYEEAAIAGVEYVLDNLI